MTHEQESVKAGVACSVGKVCTDSLKMTVSSTSDRKKKNSATCKREVATPLRCRRF